MSDYSTTELPGGEEPISTLRKDMSKEEALLKQFHGRMYTGWDYWQSSFVQARDDIKFLYQSQWDPADLKNRREARRPTLTINMLVQNVNAVVGNARRSKFSIVVKKKGGINQNVPTRLGTGSELSYTDIMSGLIRDIEQRSNAPFEYSRALQAAVEGGFGWLAIRTRRNRDDPRYVDIVIENVEDRFSVLFDPYAIQTGLQDAKWAAITVDMPQGEFKERYPEASTVNNSYFMESYGRDYHNWWGGEGLVRVTDYYYFQPKKRRTVTITNTQTGENTWAYDDEIEDWMDELVDAGFKTEISDPIDVECLYWMRCSATQIFEGPMEFPSTMIPIVPVFGRQIVVDGKRHYLSLTRYARDAQKMFNIWVSAATERVAVSPKAPWIATPQQLAGYEDEWQNQDSTNPQVLHYRHIPDEPPPQRNAPADLPAAELHMVEMGRQAIMDTTGVRESYRGEKSNETSGRAIMSRREAGEMGTYEFMDNLAQSIGQLGQILTQMIPKVYVGDRVQNIILPDDTDAEVQLNHIINDRQTGRRFVLGSLMMCRYYCFAKAGPATSTERDRFLEMMLEWGKTDPQAFSMARDLVIESIDMPNTQALSDRFKKMIPPSLLSQQERERLGTEEIPPTPEQQAEMAKNQAVMEKAKADVQIKGIENDFEIQKSNIDLQIARVNLEIAQTRLREALSNKDEGGDEVKKIAEKTATSAVKYALAKDKASK